MKAPVFHFHITRHQRATRNYGIAANRAVVRHMARRHDVIPVANGRNRFRFRAARNRVVFPNPVIIPDPQIASVTLEILVERIGTQDRSRRNFIPVAQSRPALHKNVWLEHAIHANGDILFHNAELSDAAARTDTRFRMNSGGFRYNGGRIYGHDFIISASFKNSRI